METLSPIETPKLFKIQNAKPQYSQGAVGKAAPAGNETPKLPTFFFLSLFIHLFSSFFVKGGKRGGGLMYNHAGSYRRTV